jgi:uncharacterized membrane protein
MSERGLRAGLAAVAAFAVGYLLPGTLRLPVLVYDPVARTVAFTGSMSGVEMRYYGDLLVACLAALLAFAVAFALRPRRAPIAVAAGTALSLVALDVLFYLSRLFVAM